MASNNISNEIIDLSAVEDGGGGGGRVRVPEGDYKVKIKAVKYTTSGSGNPMFVWTVVGTEGKLKGKELTEYTVLKANSYWKLRDLVLAATGKVPGAAPTRKLLEWCKKTVVGKELGVTLADDEYTNDKGKVSISSKPTDWLSLKDLSDDAPEDDDIEDEEGVEEEDGDELADMDRAQLKAHIKSEGLEIAIKKSMSDQDIRDAIVAASPEEDEEEPDEEDEDDEDESDGDGLDEMDRAELKAHIKSNKIDLTVKKSMTDDDIRAAIRSAGGDEDEEEIEDLDIDEL